MIMLRGFRCTHDLDTLNMLLLHPFPKNFTPFLPPNLQTVAPSIPSPNLTAPPGSSIPHVGPVFVDISLPILGLGMCQAFEVVQHSGTGFINCGHIYFMRRG